MFTLALAVLLYSGQLGGDAIVNTLFGDNNPVRKTSHENPRFLCVFASSCKLVASVFVPSLSG